jgi:hypothetical protein
VFLGEISSSRSLYLYLYLYYKLQRNCNYPFRDAGL